MLRMACQRQQFPYRQVRGGAEPGITMVRVMRPSSSLNSVCRDCDLPSDGSLRGPPLVRMPVSAVVAIACPLLVLSIITLVCRLSSLDIAVSSFFFDAYPDRWPRFHAEPWWTLYQYGAVPGLVMGTCGMVSAVLAGCVGRWSTWGKVGLFLALMLALGPGLLVNGLMKPHWNRPRPSQIRQFGGRLDFVSVLGRVSYGRARSFPSGHASMGFYLMAPAFALFRRNRRLAFAFVAMGLAAGGLIGLGRIVQGRHFLSDVIWSAAIVYASGVLLAVLFGFHRRRARGAVQQAQMIA